MAIIIPIIIAGVMISIVSVIIELIAYFDFLFLPHEVSGTRFIVVLWPMTLFKKKKKKKKDSIHP